MTNISTKSPTIISLSSLYGADAKKVVSAFVELTEHYSQGCCLYMPSFFSKPINYAWVIGTYYSILNTIINPYKLGTFTTDKFINKMLDTFYFLKQVNSFADSDINVVWQQHTDLLSLKNCIFTTKNNLIHDIGTQNIVKALIEIAWNKIIEIHDEDIKKIQYVIQQAKNKPVYLISNTNELNIHRALTLLRRKLPNASLDQKIDISNKQSKLPIQLAPNVFLCLSYRFGTYKTDPDNTAAFNTTPNLLKKLIPYIAEKDKCSGNDIIVISQYDKDLLEAKQQGISSNNCLVAKDYYSTNLVNPEVGKLKIT